MTIESMSPQDIHAAALSTLHDWRDHALDRLGEGDTVDAGTMISNMGVRMATILIRQLNGHQPHFQDGVWVCMSCVEMNLTIVRAAAPCAHAAGIYREILGYPAPASLPGLQLVAQDTGDPAVRAAAGELQRTYRLDAPTARAHARSVLVALSRLHGARPL